MLSTGRPLSLVTARSPISRMATAHFFMTRKCKAVILLFCISTIGLSLIDQKSSETFFYVNDYSVLKSFRRSIQCACKTCITDGDHWFINSSANPLMTTNNNLSDEDFSWWKTLQSDNSGHITFRNAVHAYFQLFPDKEFFMDASPDRCRSCAVVGNSGNLKGSHYGAVIDTHDIVIRMNNAVIKDYEEDVGKTTSLHVMYPESATDLDNTTHLVLVPFKTNDILWLISAFTTGTITKTYQNVKAKIKANKDLVMLLNPAFIKFVYDICLEKKGRYPSTGFLALMLSMQICDEVNVFGFGADKDGNWHHYWEPLHNKNIHTGPHGGMHEYHVIMQLFEKEIIHVFRGW